MDIIGLNRNYHILLSIREFNPWLIALLYFKSADKARAAGDAQLPTNAVMNETEFKAQLASRDILGARQSVQVTKACAIAFYQQQTDSQSSKHCLPTMPCNSNSLLNLSFSGVYDGRHNKKLTHRTHTPTSLSRC